MATDSLCNVRHELLQPSMQRILTAPRGFALLEPSPDAHQHDLVRPVTLTCYNPPDQRVDLQTSRQTPVRPRPLCAPDTLPSTCLSRLLFTRRSSRNMPGLHAQKSRGTAHPSIEHPYLSPHLCQVCRPAEPATPSYSTCQQPREVPATLGYKSQQGP